VLLATARLAYLPRGMPGAMPTALGGHVKRHEPHMATQSRRHATRREHVKRHETHMATQSRRHATRREHVKRHEPHMATQSRGHATPAGSM
jgi:hypothetical protein